MMLKGLTVQYLFRRTTPISKGDTVLFHAAAGGVGLIACQWARSEGIKLIGTTGSDEKCALARENGAAHVINYATEDFEARVKETKRKLLEFLIEARRAGKSVAGYGAPGKGNTLLNYCGIRTDFLDFTVDRNPYKQGKYTPGTRIPILHPDAIREARPDYLFILPWNLKDEIVAQHAYIREWGGQFVVPIPELAVYR